AIREETIMTRTNKIIAALQLGSALAALCAAAPALAQPDAAAPAAAGGLDGEVITVTARRREASLQDVPIAATAHQRQALERPRGPQGTLYGRNAIGGAIKYVARRLGADPSLSVRANLGTDEQADLIVSGSTPISDQVRIGASAARLSRGGFGENLNNGLDNY